MIVNQSPVFRAGPFKMVLYYFCAGGAHSCLFAQFAETV
jgi:hypothetical protein